MASAGAQALTSGKAPIISSGFWGFAITLGAGLIDGAISSGLMRGRGVARTPKLAGVPTGSNEPGAPRIWACGQRVRVPCHVLWQSEKVREDHPGGQKGSSGIVQRRVFIDCLLSLNDRETVSLKQLIGNGKLLIWSSRNLVQVTTAAMTAEEVGGQLVVQMADQADPDLSEYFQVGDGVRLTGFVPVGSTPSVNGVYWKVASVAAHSSSATSTLTLDPAEGQAFSGADSSGGTPFSPATIERVDDAEVGLNEAYWGVQLSPTMNVQWDYVTILARDTTFAVGDTVTVDGFTAGTGELFVGTVFRVTRTFAYHPIGLVAPPGKLWVTMSRLSGTTISGSGSAVVTLSSFTATDLGKVVPSAPTTLARSLFPANFDPAAHFHPGDDTQTADSLLVAAKGAANSPAYRGTAYQGIEQFEGTQFANALPFSMEAIIDVDPGMTWADALRAVLEWHGVPADAIDVGGVEPDPFYGFYLRGSAPAATQIQPLLVAGQIVSQEREGVIHLFQIKNADVVQIENGAARTALGARLDGEAASDDKLARIQVALEDLPTSVAVRHQDPDNVYAPGHQHFGLRSPSGVGWQKPVDLDLTNVVLTRKASRNLATTVLRRAWINSESYTFTLDARYADLLENDLVTVTTDNGDDLTLRTVQVDIGSNHLVRVVAVREDVSLTIAGSPVQSALDTYRRPPTQPALLDVAVLDIPALTPQDAAFPTLLIACAPQPGSVFQGAQVYESTDGGNTWTVVGTIQQAQTMGRVTSTVPAHAAAEADGSTTLTYDTTTTITVELSDLGWAGGLASCLPIEAEQAGRNWCAIQDPVSGAWEVLAFTSVNATSATTFELSSLLRGLRGTWVEAAAAKQAGGAFVLLTDWDTAGIRRQVSSAPAGATRLYRCVPVGATLDDVVDETVGITPLWRSASPAPPRVLTKTIGGSPYDARFETANWTRQPLPLGTLGPYSMDEPFEEYVFTILDPTGTTVRRIKRISTRSVNGVAGTPNLRDRFVDYTAAEQTADGYTPGPSATFWVRVQHVGQFGTSPLHARNI